MLKNTGSFWYCNCQPIIWMLRFIDILFVFIYFVIFVERYRIASFMLQLLNGLTSMKRSMVLVRFLFVCFCYSTTNKNENISLDQRIRCLNCFIMDFSVRICLSVCVCVCLCTHRHRLWHSNIRFIIHFESEWEWCVRCITKRGCDYSAKFLGPLFSRVVYCLCEKLCCLMNDELCQRLSYNPW